MFLYAVITLFNVKRRQKLSIRSSSSIFLVTLIFTSIIALSIALSSPSPVHAALAFANDSSGNSPLYYLPITINNNQSITSGSNFPCLVVVNSSVYSSYEASNISNINFQDGSGNILKSWLESGENNSSTSTNYWILLSDGIGANSGVTIYLVFYSLIANSKDSSVTGTEPNYTGTYGQYDTGSYVFTNYQNFKGTSTPSGWYRGHTGSDPDPTINNGVIVTSSVSGGKWISYIGSDWATNPLTVYNEIFLSSQSTYNGQNMVMVSSSSSTSYSWQANEVSYQNASGLEVESNDGYIPAVVFTASPNPTLPSIISVYLNTLYVTSSYTDVGSQTGNILASGYLAMSANTGSTAAFTIQWARQRPAPPNNIMPSSSFGNITSIVSVLRGVSVSISPSSLNGANNVILTYNVIVTNTGADTDAFNLTASDTLGWGPSLSISSTTLDAGASRTGIRLSITVPGTASVGDVSTIRVTAAGTSYENNAICTAKVITPMLPTTLTISEENFELRFGKSKILSAILTYSGSPIGGENIIWGATAGTLANTISITDASGRVSVVYTAPSYETAVIVSASYSGSGQYASSSASANGMITATALVHSGVSPLVYIGVAVVIVVIIATVLIYRARSS